MENVTPWHEQDAFWETTAPIIFTKQRWANTPAEVENVISLLDIKPGIHILDLGCGVGRHSLELARRGFKVTGVDRTKLYLEQASEKAAQEGLNIEFIQEDMRTFCQPDTFDAVINLFTSFGYFEDSEDDRKVAMNVYQSLKPGGVFLLETHGKESPNNWSWMENRWIIIKDNKRTEFKVTHRLYAATELASLLTGCGFKHVDTYGNLSRSPYDHTARRMVTAAYK